MADQTARQILSQPIAHYDHVLGPRAAKLALVQYGDFECPLCAQACPAVKLLLKDFPSEIRFAFRHYPVLEAHPHAELAAEAAEAAGGQNKFWQMHDRLFEHQSRLDPEALRRYAVELELDMRRYDAEMADHIYLQRVQEHRASARASGVQGSPAFFLDGNVVDVSFGLEHLFQAVKRRLHQRS